MTDRRAALALGALTASALGLRLFHLTRFELWVDEAATWHFARLTASGGLLEQISLEPTPPLYYGLIGVLMRLFGESDLVMRLPSAFFGAATVPAVFVLGRDLFGRRAGWIAAIFLAVHPLHVFTSREARVYPLLALLAVILWIALWRALREGSPRRWTVFSVVLALACYSHLFGLFLGAAAGAAILLWGKDRRERLRGLLAAAVAGLAFVPYLALVVPHLGASGAAWSVEAIYESLPEERRLGRPLELAFVGAGYHVYMRQIARPPTPPVLRAASLLVQVALLATAVAAARRREKTREIGFLLVAWFLPLAVPWALNHWHTFFQTGRHDFYVVGTVAVLMGTGLDGVLRLAARRTAGRAAVALAAAVLVLAAGHRLFWLHRLPAGTANRSAGEWIAAHAGAGDGVVAFGIRRLITEHYVRLAGGSVGFESFPRETDVHPGWSHDAALLDDEAALAEEGRERAAGLARRLQEGSPGGGTLYLLPRPYERTATAASESWLVDRHLLESLRRAGWRQRPLGGIEGGDLQRPSGGIEGDRQTGSLAAEDLGILALRPPEENFDDD